jgi:diguanylate cyclase (GGDEF)-like protein
MSSLLPVPLRDALIAQVRGRLPVILHELLKGLEHALIEQRMRAFSNREAQACDEFLRFCHGQGELVLRATYQAVAQGIQRMGGIQPTVFDDRGEWRLVDDAEVEDMLLARRLVRVLRDTLGALEWHVCGCYNRLLGHHVADADHPLAFEFLLRELQANLQLRHQPPAVRALFLSEVGQIMPVLLKPYLQALLDAFQLHQIEPLPEPEVLVRGRQGPAPGPSDTASCQAIRQLRQCTQEQPVAPDDPQAAGDARTPWEVLGTLRCQEAPPGGWSAQLLLQHFEQQAYRLSLRQREDTHLVSELFQHILKGGQLVPAVRPALEQLLLPVLQATLREPAAISDSTNPVRATLDRLLHLAHHSELPNKALEQRLQELIGRIVKDDRDDNEAFAACDSELDELLSLQQRACRQNVERVKQLHKGRDTLERAQREVADALAQMSGERVAQSFLDWLAAGWRELLVHGLIRQGKDSYQWRLDMSLTGMLCRQLQLQGQGASQGDQVARVYEVDHRLQILRRRMEAFSPGSYELGAVLGRLRAELLGEEPVCFVAAAPAASPPPAVPEELQRWYERIEALQEGDWLHDCDGQPLQLIWNNRDLDHYVLGNAQGREIGSFHAAELAARLADGSLLIGDVTSAPQSLIQQTMQDIVGQLYREVAHARSHDELTGLHNRRIFEGLVAQSLADGSRPSFIMVHIDQFTLLNNLAGPVAGDACLRQLASQLRHRLAAASCVARVGGVDFAAVLPGCNEAEAVKLAEQIRLELESTGFVWANHRHGITLSIGVVEAAERHDVANLFCDLQTACNSAKEAGRNRVHRFSMAADEVRTGLQAIAARVEDIVEREELTLRVQQIAPTAEDSSELPHYELLLVMQNELQLKDFIAAAERYHRMSKVDRWVLRRIFSELERHPQLWERCSGMSINLSGSSLSDDKLLGYIESLFERYRVDPRRICFELTETTAVANLAKAADLVRHLQSAGCSFSIDDFGVGFSSYEYLKRLPVDYVKIDGSFVKEIERSPSDLAMVRSINEIAHALGRQTIAEYVETPAIRARLLEMGVDYVQGFGVQKPVRLEDWLGVAAL